MTYAVPESWRELGVRRWGYHGASHKFIAERSAEFAWTAMMFAERCRRLYVNQGSTPVREPALRVISCHLGGSSSVAAILNGTGVGKQHGYEPPNPGCPRNNRVGDLDSFAVPLMMRRAGLTVGEVEQQLCKESGLKGFVRRLERHARHSGKSGPGRCQGAAGAGGVNAPGSSLDRIVLRSAKWN